MAVERPNAWRAGCVGSAVLIAPVFARSPGAPALARARAVPGERRYAHTAPRFALRWLATEGPCALPSGVLRALFDAGGRVSVANTGGASGVRLSQDAATCAHTRPLARTHEPPEPSGSPLMNSAKTGPISRRAALTAS